MVIEEVRAICAPPNFFDPSSSISPLGAIEDVWENAPLRENAYNLDVCASKVTKLCYAQACW